MVLDRKLHDKTYLYVSKSMVASPQEGREDTHKNFFFSGLTTKKKCQNPFQAIRKEKKNCHGLPLKKNFSELPLELRTF